MKLLAAIFAVLILAACSTLPRIRIGKAEVAAPKDLGTPATLNSGENKTGIIIPAGTKLVVTKTDAVEPTASTPGRPRTETLSFDFSQASEFIQTANTLAASTGTIDTRVALRRVESEEKKPLLYVSIGCAVIALGFMYFRWPTAAALSGVGSACFFAAWKLSDISPWVGALFIVAAVAGVAFYKRAEWDANGDGIPDKLQNE